MYQHDAPLRKPLQTSHLHVIGLECLDHRGAHHAEDVGHDHDNQGHDRQDQKFGFAPSVGPGRHQGYCRQEMEDNRGEQDDQGDGNHELWQRRHG